MELKNDNLEIVYKASIDHLRHRETLLFQRLNYFLVGNSFLAIAFATLTVGYFTNYQDPLPLKMLSIILSIVGLALSCGFTVINYINALHLRMNYQSVELIEIDLVNEHQNTYTPYHTTVQRILRNREGQLNKINIGDIFKDMFPKIKRLFNDCDVPAPSTWIIPSLFSVFWLVALSIIIFCHPG
jgi:hypothetical protein